MILVGPRRTDNNIVREPKRIKLSKSSDLIKSTYRWHLRLGHISLDRIKRLVWDGPLQASTKVHYLLVNLV